MRDVIIRATILEELGKHPATCAGIATTHGWPVLVVSRAMHALEGSFEVEKGEQLRTRHGNAVQVWRLRAQRVATGLEAHWPMKAGV